MTSPFWQGNSIKGKKPQHHDSNVSDSTVNVPGGTFIGGQRQVVPAKAATRGLKARAAQVEEVRARRRATHETATRLRTPVPSDVEEAQDVEQSVAESGLQRQKEESLRRVGKKNGK